MTREEAIRIIKIVLAVAEDFEIIVQGEEFTEEKCKEAVDMAIKALSSSENPNKWIDAEVLDKIREEIKSKKFGLTDTEDGRRIQSDIHAGFDGGIECALQIIDKIKAESEDKE